MGKREPHPSRFSTDICICVCFFDFLNHGIFLLCTHLLSLVIICFYISKHIAEAILEFCLWLPLCTTSFLFLKFTSVLYEINKYIDKYSSYRIALLQITF